MLRGDGGHSARRGPHLVVTGPVVIASKSLPWTFFRVLMSLSFQAAFGEPERNQEPPLSARNIPYVFSALRMTCILGGKVLILKLDLSRKRTPMGGRFRSVL